mgnify:CR=1 FL=1
MLVGCNDINKRAVTTKKKAYCKTAFAVRPIFCRRIYSRCLVGAGRRLQGHTGIDKLGTDFPCGGDGVGQTGIPGVVILIGFGVYNERIPIRILTRAHKVNQMAAILGFYDAGIAGLPAGVEDPVVEGVYHLAGGDILIQTAVGVRAGVGGVFLSQLGKMLLGGILFVLRLKLLDLLLCLFGSDVAVRSPCPRLRCRWSPGT